MTVALGIEAGALGLVLVLLWRLGVRVARLEGAEEERRQKSSE